MVDAQSAVDETNHPHDAAACPSCRSLERSIGAAAGSIASVPVRRSPWQSRARVLVGGLVVGCAIAGGATAVVLGLNHHARGSRAAPGPDQSQITATASWIDRELSHDARVVADSSVADALARAGFGHLTRVVPGSTIAQPGIAALSFDYVVSTPAVRAAARSDAGLYRALTSSIPLAVFSAGTQEFVVREVSTVSGAERASRRLTQEQDRRAAGLQLLANPGVRATGAAVTALRAGEVDLRVATVVALMANAGQVDLLSINVDEPEHAAGLPARSINVRSTVGPTVQAIVTNLPASYRPSSDTLLPDGAELMVWPIDVDPPVLN